MNRDKRASEITKSISNILLNDWDPLGVRQFQNTIDEYDAYIGEIYRLLSKGASEHEICKHLAHIEEESMGLGSRNPETLTVVVRKLINLNVRL